jgi:hypothetical protein
MARVLDERIPAGIALLANLVKQSGAIGDPARHWVI